MMKSTATMPRRFSSEINTEDFNYDKRTIKIGRDNDTNGDNWVITSDEDLQEYWKSLESRVVKKKSKKLDEINESVKIGRSSRRTSPWDAEEV